MKGSVCCVARTYDAAAWLHRPGFTWLLPPTTLPNKAASTIACSRHGSEVKDHNGQKLHDDLGEDATCLSELHGSVQSHWQEAFCSP